MAGRQKPVIVVTGASKGIGFAVTAALLRAEAIVVAISRSRPPELVSLLRKYPATLLVIEANVADEPGVREAIGLAMKTFQHIDGLILNAGTNKPMGMIGSSDTTTDSWRAHFDVNFFSLLYTIQAALPALRKSVNGGRIIFISSGSAVGGTPSLGAYNASKAAMNSLCRTLAQEEPEIVSIALRPGMVDTDMQAVLRSEGPKYMREGDVKRFIQAHREGALVKPEDVAHVIAGLVVGAPKVVSGQFISWDGDDCKEFKRS